MRTTYLPAKDSKGNDRVEKITNAKLLPPAKNDRGEDVPQTLTFEIPAESFGGPQYDSWDEAVKDAGSEEKALAFFNKAAFNAAITRAKNYIRNAAKSSVGKAGNYQDVIDAGIKLGVEFSLAVEEELSTKEKAQAFDALVAAAKGGNMSNEDMLATLRKLTGAA